MRELRFHRGIYSLASVDEALRVFARFGRFEREEMEEHVRVRVYARDAARERALAGELANYALGLAAGEGLR